MTRSARPKKFPERRVRLSALTISTACSAALIPAFAHAQESGGEIAEVIVTAQKRAENVQDVPIPVTAIGTARLQNVAATVNTVNLQQFVPGLVQGRSGTAGATFLRGVGTEAGVAGTESPVATYIDGVYLGVNALGVFELNNIEQVSVLKGPQGTLFGRNAAGGAIQITTRDPNLDQGEADLELGYGNYDTTTARLYGSTPFTTNLAGNISVLYKDRQQGTVYNLFTGNKSEAEEVFSAQAKLLWDLSDRTQLKLNVMHSQGNDLPGINYFVQKGAVAQDGRNTWVGPHTVNFLNDSLMETDVTIGALTFSHDFGWARVTNILTRTDFENRAFNDQALTTGLPNPGNVAGAGAFLSTYIDEWTEELQIQSPDDSRLRWIVGFFYFNDETDTDLRAVRQAVPGGPQLPGFALDSLMTTDSWAVYAQGTGEIFPDTNLTLGVRYTRDDKDFSGQNNFGGTVPATLPPESTFDKMSYRVALDHHVTDDVMVYASYNRGFRAGTYSSLSLANPPARPESLDAFEIGFKSDLLGRKLRLNSSAFYYDYKDLQIRANVGAPIVSLILNAAEAEIYGLDVDLEAVPTNNLRIIAAMELLHAEYTSFPNGPGNYPVGVPQLGMMPVTSAPPGCVGTPRPGVGGHSNVLSCDLSGNDAINAPDFSASLGIEYTMPTSLGDFTFSASDKYTGKSFASPDNFQVLESYHYVTASIGWTSSSGRFYGKLWGTNLADSDRPAQLAFGLNTYEFLPGEPVFYGVTFGVRY